MPFTFAHPLFAAPLKLIKPIQLSLTGLILGSMAPDFEYFIVLEPYETIGHSLKGLLLQVIPLSILFAYLFHFIIKASLVRHLPGFYNLDSRAQGLIQEWRLDNVQKWLIFLLSVSIGFCTHLFVDAFTHQTGEFVTQLPVLHKELLDRPLYKILQYMLSLIGLAVEFIFMIYMLKKAQPSGIQMRLASKKQKILYWAIAFIVMIITVLLKLILTSSDNFAGILIVAPISGFSIGILISSCLSRNNSYS